MGTSTKHFGGPFSQIVLVLQNSMCISLLRAIRAAIPEWDKCVQNQPTLLRNPGKPTTQKKKIFGSPPVTPSCSCYQARIAGRCRCICQLEIFSPVSFAVRRLAYLSIYIFERGSERDFACRQKSKVETSEVELRKKGKRKVDTYSIMVLYPKTRQDRNLCRRCIIS